MRWACSKAARTTCTVLNSRQLPVSYRYAVITVQQNHENVLNLLSLTADLYNNYKNNNNNMNLRSHSLRPYSMRS